MLFDSYHRLRCWLGVAQTSPPVLERRRGGLLFVGLICFVAGALAGCSLDSGPGSYLVDPARYDLMQCKDLVAQWKNLSAREQELRKLQARASEGTGGAIIGAISYRPDFEAVLADKKNVQREAAEKNCALTPTYQSDHTIQ
jgi:hypothetical protein